jgi:hypothetical protein
LGVPLVSRVRLSAAIFLPSRENPTQQKDFRSILNAVQQVLAVLILSFLSLYGFLALQYIHSVLSAYAQAVPDGCQVANFCHGICRKANTASRAKNLLLSSTGIYFT